MPTTPHHTPPRALLALALAAVAASLVGCLEELPDETRVDDLRVLAIVADPPEVGPGANVTVDALVVDPMNRPREVSWAWCVIPEQGFGLFGGSGETSSSGGGGVALDDPGSCFARAAAGEPLAGLIDGPQGGGDGPVSLAIPPDLLEGGDALRAAYQLPDDVTIPAEIEAAFLGIAGVNVTVALRVDIEGRRIEASKRINVSLPSPVPGDTVNENPRDIAFHLAPRRDEAEPPTQAPPPLNGRCLLGEDDGVTLTRGTSYTISPVNVPDPQPVYAVLLGGTTTDEPFEITERDENWFFAFYATAGSIDRKDTKSSAGGSNTWSIPDDAVGPIDLWIVVRDGRGGTSWCASRLPVATP